jgi:hypothetical protein
MAKKRRTRAERDLHASGAYGRAAARARAWEQAGAGAAPVSSPVNNTALPIDNKAGSWRSLIAGRIRAEGFSYNALGKATGVDVAVIQRYVTGERDVRAATLEKLCGALGLVLVPKGRLRGSGSP